MITSPKLKFYIDFITDGFGLKELDNEPIGFDAIDFNTKKEEGRHGMDVFFAGGEFRFTFTKLVHDEVFDKLVEYFENYGWESEAKLIIEIEGVKTIIGDFDFLTCDNNQVDEIKFDVIQNNNQQILKRRADLQIDLLSDKDIDGNPIEPIETHDFLLKSKEIQSVSEWDMGTGVQQYSGKRGRLSVEYRVQPFMNIIQEGIDSTFSGALLNFQQKIETLPVYINDYKDIGNFTDFSYIEAQTDINNAKATVNFSYLVDFKSDEAVINDTYGLNTRIMVMEQDLIGQAYIVKYFYNFVDLVGTATDGVPSRNNPFEANDVVIPLGDLKRGDRVVLLTEASRKYNNPVGTPPELWCNFAFTRFNLKIEGSTSDYSRKIKGVRLVDVVKQICKSTAGLEIDSDILNNELYNQFVFDGNRLRGIKDRPFYYTFNEVLANLKETFLDYVVLDRVQFLRYNDFYSNEEIYIAEDVRFDSYLKKFNQDYSLNQFKYKYEKHQAEKENVKDNSFGVISGNINLNITNRFVENTKDIDLKMSRDSYLIESVRRESYKVEDNSTQDDNSKFFIDGIDYVPGFQEERVTVLHVANNNRLLLINDNTFDWSDLGLEFGNVFSIDTGSFNAGSYVVSEVQSNILTLTPNTVIPLGFGTALITDFRYLPTGYDFQSRGSEGIDTENILLPDSFANLNYSVKRNIVKHYNSYLATANIFKKNNPITVSFYENNRDAITDVDGLKIEEGADFTPTNPILNPYVHEMIILMDYQTYFKLENDARTKKGFIRALDGKGNVVRVYPREMAYNFRDKACLVLGEEKFDNKEINITYANNGYFVLNDKYTVTNFIFSEYRNKISIFDDSNKLMFPATYWQKVSVNGVFANDLNELKGWLEAIS
tara:strand:- start:8994 stop:11642 length:2649 start_codon:yes stop_codon:yes gene_type:complete